MSTQDDDAHRVIDENGIPVTQAGEPRGERPAGERYVSMPIGDSGYAARFALPDPFEGKHPLRTKTGWKLVGVATLVVAIVVGLVTLSLVVAAFVIPALVLVAVVAWLVARVRGPRHGGAVTPYR